ncbi:MAG: DUF559 domain-containing protein [Deltaproteobacteria bacterium]|nr:DUF559 domain-containing protein [Deltaproteobacteria bacterium]
MAAAWRRACGRLKFHRQHRSGPYCVDSCCLKPRLLIERDGSQPAV